MGLDTDSLYTLLIEWPQAHCTSHMEMETDELNLIEINYKCLNELETTFQTKNIMLIHIR